MTLYAQDEDGACICVDCIHGGCNATCPPTPCEHDECQCSCMRDPEADRARELDDREPDKLAVIAAEMESERHGDVPGRYSVDDLTAERFGHPTRRAA